MQGSRRGGWIDPATWYLLAGVVLIGATLWLPWYTAARTARVELRADRIAELLLTATRGLPAPPTADDLESVLARFFALANADGVFLADLERVAAPAPEVLLALQNKHYAIQLALAPADPTATVGRDTVPALEVLAWPLGIAGPGHSVYYHAQDAPRAYTRNLGSGFHGWQERRPLPGAGQRRAVTTVDTPSYYRSANDERWIHY